LHPLTCQLSIPILTLVNAFLGKNKGERSRAVGGKIVMEKEERG